jgi:hypothetical protein
MPSRRVHLGDSHSRVRSIIEHNPVTHEVSITISGPSGGIHGQITVPEDEAVEAFRDIIGSVMGIAQRSERAGLQRGPLGTSYPGQAIPDSDVTW